MGRKGGYRLQQSVDFLSRAPYDGGFYFGDARSFFGLALFLMSDAINLSCPVCREDESAHKCEGPEVHSVRGENIEVAGEYYRCTACETEFQFSDEGAGLEQARKLYRQSRDWLMPEQIASWRSAQPLTSEELETRFGWTPGMLSRYEKGYLQTETHEAQLRAAMQGMDAEVSVVA